MSEFKEVWRPARKLKSGDTAEVSAVMYASGKVERKRGTLICKAVDHSPFESIFNEIFGFALGDPIVAYTTGEMRRRVDCRKCLTRYRYADIPTSNGCPECNKGKVWEYAE